MNITEIHITKIKADDWIDSFAFLHALKSHLDLMNIEYDIELIEGEIKQPKITDK